MDRNEDNVGVPAAAEEKAGAVVHPMDAYLEGLETPRRGEVRKGTVARVAANDVWVDIGAKSEGVIPAQEMELLSEEERAGIQVGREITVYVVRTGDRDGGVVLSLGRAQEEKDWVEAERMKVDQSIYDGSVSGYNKGGLIVKVGGLRGFIPSSQVSLARRRRAEGDTLDQRWGKMVGEPIVAKVIEVDRKRNRLILSERAAARESREALKERLIAELRPGETRTGTVISLAEFGAFVDIGGADGLVHSSEISWKRVGHPKEVLAIGQEVQVKVLGIDPERRRISLSLRELESDPWEQVAGQLREGQLLEGTITKLTKFGAFASLEGLGDFEVEGLIHISELADRRVEDPREVVDTGQKLRLRVIKLDRERRRIGLSLKRVDSMEFADLDWQAAAEDAPLAPIPPNPAAEDVVEDFDAALDAETTPAEAPAESGADDATPAQPPGAQDSAS
ncbi:MAG: S1 RNA-binding domain-containing protein [Anaerolineales bacterium]